MAQDNYIGKVSRIHIENKTFKSDDGRDIKYSRLCLSITLKGQTKVLEFAPANKSKMEDIETFLGLAESVAQGNILN